jgi:proliferating cell nuclear antigen PCNA
LIFFLSNKKEYINNQPNYIPERKNMLQLPKEINVIIMKKLRIRELIILSLTCKSLNNIFNVTEWKWDIIFKDKNKNDHILEIYIEQTGAFKQMIKNISEIVSDCCMTFTPPCGRVAGNHEAAFVETQPCEDSTIQQKGTSKNFSLTGGIDIIRLNETKDILIKLKLDAAKFEYFKCDMSKIVIGIYMNDLYESLKTINEEDPIVLYMNRDNINCLYIKSIHNESNKEIILMDKGNPGMPIPQTIFQSKITMASDKFHTICKQLNNNSAFIEIILDKNKILFKGGNITTSYNINHNNEPNKIIKSTYEIKNLLPFSKCDKSCNTIDIYLKKDFPLVLEFSVATLGKMYVFIAPVEI